MDLRQLKQNVHALPNVQENVEKFQQHWIKPLRSNTNSHLPFLQRLQPSTKKELNQKITLFYDTLGSVQQRGAVHEKLKSYAHYLVELKLATLRDDTAKATMLTNHLLKDEMMNVSQTLIEVQAFSDAVTLLSEQYHELNGLVQQHLSLEETLFLMDLPHKMYLATLVKTARDQKRLLVDLGRHFV